MNTRYLMSLSAALMALAGVIMLFLPQELMAQLDMDSAAITALILQTMGALYLGFAIMNWMAKGVLIGGIYARPLAMGNFTHFMIGALGLLKASFASEETWGLWLVALLYTGLAIAFGLVSFRHPLKAGNSE